MSEEGKSDSFLRVIAIFKLLKAVLFLAAAIGVLKFFNKDVEIELAHALDQLHVDSDNHYAQALITNVGHWTDSKQKLIGLSAISLFYAGLFGTEGTGLLLRKRWAEWFVVIVTGSLLPFEIYEIIQKVTVVKIGLTVVNLLIIGYLVIVIRRKQAK